MRRERRKERNEKEEGVEGEGFFKIGMDYWDMRFFPGGDRKITYLPR